MATDILMLSNQHSLDLKGLKKELRPYQEYGVQYILNQGAVLLGDEMGLGKTAQAIAAMTCLRNAVETLYRESGYCQSVSDGSGKYRYGTQTPLLQIGR